MPLRNLSITTRNKVREITDDFNWPKSLSQKAVAIRTVVNSQSPNSARAIQNAVMKSQSDEVPKLILSSLKNKRDKTSNATRRIVASGNAKSSTSWVHKKSEISKHLLCCSRQLLSNQLKTVSMQKSRKGATILTQF